MDPPPPYTANNLYPNLPPAGGPFYGAPPTGVYTYSQPGANVDAHYGAAPQVSKKKEDHGFLSSIMSSAGKAVSSAGKIAATALQELSSTVDKYCQSPTMNFFQTNNVIQLTSRSSGHNLQILMASDGQLVLDGLGPDSPQAFNTLFTVTRLKYNLVYLHNNFNYLAIRNGVIVLHIAGPNGQPTPNCQFALHEPALNFISLESTCEKGHCVGVLTNGILKSALVTTSDDKDSHFVVRLVSSPYGPTGMPPPSAKTPQ